MLAGPRLPYNTCFIFESSSKSSLLIKLKNLFDIIIKKDDLLQIYLRYYIMLEYIKTVEGIGQREYG